MASKRLQWRCLRAVRVGARSARLSAGVESSRPRREVQHEAQLLGLVRHRARRRLPALAGRALARLARRDGAQPEGRRESPPRTPAGDAGPRCAAKKSPKSSKASSPRRHCARAPVSPSTASQSSAGSQGCTWCACGVLGVVRVV